MLYQYLLYLNTSAANTTYRYSDDYLIHDWARESVYKMYSLGYMVGYQNEFRPLSNMTRAECASVIARLCGQNCPVFHPPAADGKYKLTCYCAGCNYPKGSRETASGKEATPGQYGTIAVHRDLYSSLKGKVLYIEGVGYRKVQDIHGNSKNVIDVYVSNSTVCNCRSNSISGKTARVWIVK